MAADAPFGANEPAAPPLQLPLEQPVAAGLDLHCTAQLERGFNYYFFSFSLSSNTNKWAGKKKLAYSEIVRPPSYVGKKIRYEPDICKYACRLCRRIGYLSTLWVTENADRCCGRPAFNKVTLLSPSSAPLKTYRMYKGTLMPFLTFPERYNQPSLCGLHSTWLVFHSNPSPEQAKLRKTQSNNPVPLELYASLKMLQKAVSIAVIQHPPLVSGCSGRIRIRHHALQCKNQPWGGNNLTAHSVFFSSCWPNTASAQPRSDHRSRQTSAGAESHLSPLVRQINPSLMSPFN